MKLTLADAETHSGVSRSTLLRAIRKGDLTAERRGPKAFVVDASELSRWKDARQVGAPAAPDDAPGHVMPQPAEPPPDVMALAAEAASWRVKAEALERELARADRALAVADATAEDLRARLDRAETEAADARSKALDSLMAVLPRLIPAPETPKAEPEPTPPAPVTERPRGWRLWGR